MKSAVLVIDVQKALFDPEPRPYEADLVVEKINKVSDWARAKSYPVIFIQHETPDEEIPYATEGWQLEENLLIQAQDHFIRKTTPDSFLKTDLAELLKQEQIDQLIICGYASEFCVDTTTRRAAALGYPVTLVADAHTTHDKTHASGQMIRQHHNATLSNIESFGVLIQALPVEEIMA